MDSYISTQSEPSVNPTPYHSRTFAEIDAINREFWRKRCEKTERQLRDEHLAKDAFDDLNEQYRLQAPHRLQESFGVLLDKAEKRRERVLVWVRQENGRKGGKARTPSRLQGVIQQIVARNPAISCPALLKSLTQKQHGSVIEDVDEESIWFIGTKGQSQSIKITSLKHCLYRAKIKLSRGKPLARVSDS